jgi:hypothetical protein
MSKSTKHNTKTHTCLSTKEAKALQDDLKRFGYLLPTSDEELEAFENIFGTTKVMLPAHLKNPDFIANKKASSESNLKPVKEKASADGAKKKVAAAPVKKITANAYFKKLVLAAEITTQLHKEYSFGHIKFVKVQYLCDQVSNMDLESNYRKFAAGPLDPKLIYSIDAEFKRRKWFVVTKTNYGYKYAPDVNAQEYKIYYLRYFGNVQDKINYIIDLFRKEKSDFCEIVATLFAVWKEYLENNKPINDSMLAKSFYAWSPEKKRFNENKVKEAINWMKDKDLVPS